MRDMNEIREDSLRHGLCSEWDSRWSACRSRKEIFDMGATIDGMEFVRRMLNEGWGFGKDELESMFSHYINGRYISEHGGKYRSEAWIGFKGETRMETALAGFFSCDCVIYIKPFHICHMFADRDSRLTIHVPDSSKAYLHADGADLTITGRPENAIMKTMS